MLRLIIFLFTVIILCSTPSAYAKTLYTDKGEVPGSSNNNIEDEAKRGLEEILDIWRDGKYDDLYERTFNNGKHTKEAFINKLKSASHKPACCGEKIQDVRVTVKNSDSVAIKAKLGLEAPGTGTEFSTKPYKLVKEDGVWKMSMSDILSLAGSSKKKAAAKAVHHHRKK